MVTPHAHYWRIESPCGGAVVHAVCDCGAERDYLTSYDESGFRKKIILSGNPTPYAPAGVRGRYATKNRRSKN